jgi:addiction module RelE/StbE family toxin
MRILYSSKFIKQYRRLPLKIKILFEEKEEIFRINQYDVTLKTHKLHGVFKGYYSFSVNYKYRVIFDYGENNDTINFHQVGTHDIYEN